MKSGFLGEKCCCVTIVEFNSSLSLFSGVQSGFFCCCFGFVFVLLLFFSIFDVKVGRGKMRSRVESMCLQGGSRSRKLSCFSLVCH